MSAPPLKPGWLMVKFGDVVKNVNSIERNPSADSRIVGLEHIDPENLHIRRWMHPEDGTSFSRKFVPGQTLFGKRRSYQRKVAFAEFEGICSGDILTFEPKDHKRLLARLLPFICQSDTFYEYALETSAGSLSPRTSWSALKNYEFLLPPLEEQKRIAEILWAADEAACAFQKALKHADMIAKLYLSNVFNKFKAVGMPLSDVLTESPKSGCSASPSSEETGHWVLSLSALSAKGYIRGHLKPVEKSPKMMQAKLAKGDLLISRSNTIELVGLAGIFDENRADVSFPDTMMRLPVNTDKILPKYLEIMILSRHGRRHMMATASGTSSSMKKINRKTLFEFKLPVPDLKKQHEIIENYSNYIDKYSQLALHISRLKNTTNALTNKMLST